MDVVVRTARYYCSMQLANRKRLCTFQDTKLRLYLDVFPLGICDVPIAGFEATGKCEENIVLVKNMLFFSLRGARGTIGQNSDRCLQYSDITYRFIN